MMLTIYGDMDVSRLMEKPKQIADINIFKTRKKIDELVEIIKKELFKNNQIFWVCSFNK